MRLAASVTDLDFYEICGKYVASLQDAHVSFTFPSNFSASLWFSVDLYDGAPLIDSIGRARLPSSRYPFQIGDAPVFVDGVAAEDLIRKFLKYSVAANERSARRSAVGRITTRLLADTLMLRHSREMTLLCSPKVTHHNVDAVALLPLGKRTPLPLEPLANTTGSGKRTGYEKGRRAAGARLALALGQSVFFVWVGLSEQKWIILAERRG